MNVLKTKYSPNCQGSSVNSNSLMYYEVPGGSAEICPQLNCLVWGQLTKKPNGSSYVWGDTDPTTNISGFEWGYSCSPYISLHPTIPGAYITSTGDWTNDGNTMTFVAAWEVSSNGGVTWTPANPANILTTNFTDDSYRVPVGITQIRSIVKVITSLCPTGNQAYSIIYNI